MDKICISIRRDTHARLVVLGKKKDSFDDIIQRLIEANKTKYQEGIVRK